MKKIIYKISSIFILGGVILSCGEEKEYNNEEISMMRERVLKTNLIDKFSRNYRVSISVPQELDNEELQWNSGYLSASITLRGIDDDNKINEATFNIKVPNNLNLDNADMYIAIGKNDVKKYSSIRIRKSNLPKEDLFKVLSFNIPLKDFNKLIIENKNLDTIYIKISIGMLFKLETSNLENFRDKINSLIKDEDGDNTKLALPIEAEEIEEDLSSEGEEL